MKPKPETEFSWNLLFGVTAFSFAGFSLLLRSLHGSQLHAALFRKIGIISGVLLFVSIVTGAIVQSTVAGDE